MSGHFFAGSEVSWVRSVWKVWCRNVLPLPSGCPAPRDFSFLCYYTTMKRNVYACLCQAAEASLRHCLTTCRYFASDITWQWCDAWMELTGINSICAMHAEFARVSDANYRSEKCYVISHYGRTVPPVYGFCRIWGKFSGTYKGELWSCARRVGLYLEAVMTTTRIHNFIVILIDCRCNSAPSDHSHNVCY